jgi:hypothetical protein
MGLFRSIFHSKAEKTREKAAVELPEEHTETAVELPEEQTETAVELPEEQIETVEPRPRVAAREPKYEARPDPDKPGWGLTMGQDIFKVREHRDSHE